MYRQSEELISCPEERCLLVSIFGDATLLISIFLSLLFRKFLFLDEKIFQFCVIYAKFLFVIKLIQNQGQYLKAIWSSYCIAFKLLTLNVGLNSSCILLFWV